MAERGPVIDGEPDEAEGQSRTGWLSGSTYAHRGLHSAKSPENSLAAFEAALQAGHGIECDVRRSRDGRAMVFHDEMLERLTGQSGALNSSTVGELTQMRIGGSDQTIPTLLDLLRLVGGDRASGSRVEAAKRAPLLIELKTDEARSVVPLCRSVRADLEGYLGPVAVMSFDPRVCQWFAQKSPETLRGLVVSEHNARTLSASFRRWRFMRMARPEFLACDIRDLPSRIASKAQAKGLPLVTWTVRTKEHLTAARDSNAAPIFEGEIVAAQLGKGQEQA